MQKEIRFRWVIFTVVALGGFLFDWYTKFLAEKHLSMGNAIDVIGTQLQFYLVYNKGALFGLNPRTWIPSFPVNQFFFVFTIIAMTILIFYYRSLNKKDRLMHWGLALVMPGALGNLWDRVIHPGKGVVDFIKVDLGFPPLDPWPIFNVADIYVSVGVGIIILCQVLDEIRKKKEGSLSSTVPETSNPQRSKEIERTET